MRAGEAYDEHPTARRPHHVNPSLASVRVVLAIKNFSNIPGVCHIGLGVTAANTMKVLRRHGVQCEAWSTQTAAELQRRLTASAHDVRPVTHVVISAPSWVQPNDLGRLAFLFPNIEFVQLNHSGTAYLSIDKFGIRNIRAAIDLERTTHNVRVAWNNPRGQHWATMAFGQDMLLLPNLYDDQSFVNPIPARKDHDPLRIGSFGASRPWKNQLTAAEAAVSLARRMGVQLELYVNSKRPDGGERMIESRKELFDGLRGAKLIDVPWEPWPRFRKTVANMDILFSPSFDETFNVVTADGIAEGIPSVTTGALEWTPKHWQAEPWDPQDVVRVARGLLHDKHAGIDEARRMLHRFVKDGVRRWIDYLTHA